MRKLKNWIESYIGYVAPASESPLAYIYWSAATALSTVLKRNVYVGRGTYRLHPNLFTVLVGRPGIGKGTAIKPAVSLMKEAKVANTLSGRITIEYVLERLSVGWPTVLLPGTSHKVSNESNCMIYSTELSVFLSASQNTLPILCDLWDFDEGEFEYGTRHKGEFRIKNPCISLLGGSTQEWLISSIPSSAVGGGFTRRVNFVVANDREKLLPWPVVQNHSAVRDALVQDLISISQLKGECQFAADVKPLFEKCYIESTPTEYDDEATTSYKTSLWAQVVKLAMVMSVSRGDDLIINKEDFRKSYDAIMTVAGNVPRVFRGVGESELVVVTDKILRFLEKKGYANKQEITKALWRDVTHEDLDKILATLLQGSVIYEYQQGRNTMYAVKDYNTVKGSNPQSRKIKGVSTP